MRDVEQKSGGSPGNIRTFYLLLITQVFSSIGSKISAIAVGIWVFTETGNATPLTLVSFFAVLPQVIASSFSGVIADRWDRRLVMVLSDAGQAVGTLALFISFASGNFQLWHLYAVAVWQATFGVFQGPAFSASVTMLIPDDQRDRANTLMQLTQPSAGVIAPLLAGLVYALVDVEGAILIDMLTFVAAMIVIFGMHIPRPTVTAEGLAARGSMWKEMFSGLEYLLKRRLLLYVMLYAAMVNLMLAGMGALGTPYILARTGNNEAELGVILSLVNVGALVGGFAFSAWGGKIRPRTYAMIPGVAMTGMILVGIGMAQNTIVLAFAYFLMLTPIPMANASIMSVMQTKTAPDLQGRVFAVMGQISMILTPISYFVVGPLADEVFEPAVGGPGWEAFAPLVGDGTGAGIGLMMVISGSTVAAISLVMFAWPRFRKLESLLPDYVAAVETPESITTDEADNTGESAPVDGESMPPAAAPAS